MHARARNLSAGKTIAEVPLKMFIINPLKHLFWTLWIVFCGIVCNALFANEYTLLFDLLIPISFEETSFSGIEGIDAIYLINLDRRGDRLAYMKQLFLEHGLHAQRLSACDGERLSLETIKTLIGPYSNSSLLKRHPGAVGCIISHISVLYDAFIRGFKVIWVLEDDVEILENPKQLNVLMKQLNAQDPSWAIFYTDPDFRRNEHQCIFPLIKQAFRPGQVSWECDRKERRIPLIEGVIDRVYYRWGTHSMIISAEGIHKMIDHFLHSHLYTPIDIDMHTIAEMRQYCSVVPIVTNGFRFTTDIRKVHKKPL